MKGKIGTATSLFVIKERKLTKTEKKKAAKVKGPHKIKTEYPKLDAVAERKKQREQKQQQHGQQNS